MALLVAYSVPHPIQMVRRVAAVAGPEVLLTIALALRQTSGRKLRVQTWDANHSGEMLFPAGRDFAFKLYGFRGDRVSLHFVLEDFPQWVASAVLYALPVSAGEIDLTPPKTAIPPRARWQTIPSTLSR